MQQNNTHAAIQPSHLGGLTSRKSHIVDPVKHYAYLDALRGLAFLCVLAVHTNWHIAGLPEWCSQLGALGNYGVQLFFILSALTLCMSMQSRAGTTTIPVVSFAIRRFFRIAPMYWAALIFYYFFSVSGTYSESPDSIYLVQIITNVFFVHGWHPATINSVVPGGWSIAVEMNFYLIFPILFLYLRDIKKTLIALCVSIPISILISVSVYRWIVAAEVGIPSDLAHNFTYYWLPRQFVVFLLGIALFHLLRNDGKNLLHQFRDPGDYRILIFGLSLLVLAVLIARWLPVAYLVFSLIFVVLILGLSIYPTRWIVNPLIRYTGTVSYSAYLTHFAVVQVVSNLFHDYLKSATSSEGSVLRFVIFYLACWGLTLCVATLTYRMIEVPFQNVGKRLTVALQNKK